MPNLYIIVNIAHDGRQLEVIWEMSVNIVQLTPNESTLCPTHGDAAWSDHHGTIAFVWPEPSRPGLQQLRQVRGFAAL